MNPGCWMPGFSGWQQLGAGGSGSHATAPPCPIPLVPAGLRRSFRLGRRERLGSPQEAKTPAVESPELLTYEEVTRYQQQPGERPRLVVLIGRSLGLCAQGGAGFPPGGAAGVSGALVGVASPFFLCCPGSLGARLQELKQKVVAENPQHFGVAVPRKGPGAGRAPHKPVSHGGPPG